jgi:hypothetical protein
MNKELQSIKNAIDLNIDQLEDKLAETLKIYNKIQLSSCIQNGWIGIHSQDIRDLILTPSMKEQYLLVTIDMAAKVKNNKIEFEPKLAFTLKNTKVETVQIGFEKIVFLLEPGYETKRFKFFPVQDVFKTFAD